MMHRHHPTTVGGGGIAAVGGGNGHGRGQNHGHGRWCCSPLRSPKRGARRRSNGLIFFAMCLCRNKSGCKINTVGQNYPYYEMYPTQEFSGKISQPHHAGKKPIPSDLGGGRDDDDVVMMLLLFCFAIVCACARSLVIVRQIDRERRYLPIWRVVKTINYNLQKMVKC